VIIGCRTRAVLEKVARTEVVHGRNNRGTSWAAGEGV
jgi:hypothetical protein